MKLNRAIKATERSLIHTALRTAVGVGALVAPGRTADLIVRRFFATSRPGPERLRFTGLPPRVATLEVPDGLVATYRWGDRSGAPTVLLAHGWNGWAQQLEPFVGPLVEKGFAVLAIDHVAHGRSDGASSSLPAMIRTTGRVLADTPNVVGAIAHSMGAAALAAVLAETRRSLAGAVLIAPPNDPRPYLQAMARTLGAPRRLLPVVRDRAEASAGVPFDRLVMHPWIARRIRTPMLIVHDIDDRDVPIAHGYAYTMGTGARLLATDGLGHNRILRDRHVVDSAVDFVAKRVRREALALAA